MACMWHLDALVGMDFQACMLAVEHAQPDQVAFHEMQDLKLDYLCGRGLMNYRVISTAYNRRLGVTEDQVSG